MHKKGKPETIDIIEKKDSLELPLPLPLPKLSRRR